MRIAHFMVGRCNPDSANGIDKSVYYLASSQAALGHQVALFSVSPKPAIPVPGVDARTYPPLVPPDLPRWSLWRELLAWGPDVVHLHSLYVPANILVSVGLRWRRLPYVVTPHGAADQHVLRRRAAVKRPYRLLAERPTLNRAAFVHAIADAAPIREYGVVAPIVVAPNGIDPMSVPPHPDRRGGRARLGVDSTTRLALFLGRLDHVHKGLDLLVDAFATALPRAQNLALILVGPDRGSRRMLEESVARLGLTGRVRFFGAALGTEKFDLLAAADVVIQPSRWEAGVPLSVLEALVVGRPCLVSEAADPLRCIERYGAGTVVAPTVHDIARGLERFATATDETLRREGERAAVLARQEFAWPTTARTLVNGYVRYALTDIDDASS